MIGVEGVNTVFSQVSLILLLLSFSSISGTLLLTSFFAPFLVARDPNFLSCFYTFCTLNTTLYMRPHIAGTDYAFSQSKTLVGTCFQKLVSAFFPCSAFFQRFLMQTSIGRSQFIPFLPIQILELTLSCMTQASATSMQYNSGKES